MIGPRTQAGAGQLREIATRAHVEWSSGPKRPVPWRRPPRHERPELLVIDTETVNLNGGRVGRGYQSLLLVGWRHALDGAVIEEGLAYPDDLPRRDRGAYRRLRAYVRTHGSATVGWASRAGQTRPEITLMPVSQFLDERVYALCFRRRVALVGHNLPFDVGRLARHWSAARPVHRGAVSLSLWGGSVRGRDRPALRAKRRSGSWDDGPGRPRCRVQHIDRHGALMSWTAPTPGTGSEDRGRHWRGRFLDTHTLAYALSGEDLSLAAACARFGIEADKVPCTFGRLDGRLVDHVRADVAATAAVADRLLDLAGRWARRHNGQPVVLDPARLHSPAGLADALLDALGVTPISDRLRDGALDRAGVLAVGMQALYGGRAEVRVVGQRVPVLPVDWGAMYPSVSVLLGVARHWRAARIVTEDATGLVRDLLAPCGLAEQLRRPATWKRLGLTFIELEPGGEPWPRRVRDSETGEWRLGVGPLRYAGWLWFAWPDVAAATLATGRLPRIRRAVRLVPRGTADGLRPVRFASGARLDLAADADPFATLVAARRQLESFGDDALARGSKVAANALAHGLPSRVDRERYARPKPLRATVAAGPDDRIETRLHHVEAAGPWTFPPVAAVVTAGARLMLAMLEHALIDAGATVPWVYGDTDGVGIVAAAGDLVPCAGGPERLPDGAPAVCAVSFAPLRSVLDGFAPLNVFGHGSPWRIEHDAMARPLDAYVVALKRYALVCDTAEGVEVVWASEHGLGGVLADLYEGELDERSGVSRFAVEAWRHLIDPERDPLPPWARLPALEPRAAGTPRIAQPAGVRPFAFYYQARPPLLAARTAAGAVLAPYESDPARWPDGLAWSREGAPVWVHVGQREDGLVVAGAVTVGTLGDELTRYRRTPLPAGWEPITAGDNLDEEGPCVLVPALVDSDPAHRALIGREAFDEPEHGDNQHRTMTYQTCRGCGAPLADGQSLWCPSCHDGHNAGWRRRRLGAATPRCADCDQQPVSRRGALCRDCGATRRRTSDAARKRKARASAPRTRRRPS